MEALDPIVQSLLKDAALPAMLAATLVVVLRWGLGRIDSMIGSLTEALESAGARLADEQRAHAAIMQALTEITSTQVRITETLARIERNMDDSRRAA